MLALAPVVAFMQPASAADTTTSEDPSAVVTWTGSADAELYDAAGNHVLASQHYDQATMGQTQAPLNAQNHKPNKGDVSPASWEEGTGGSSSASGCQKVTVHNTGHNLLGSVAYRFNTWTYWCWNRANYNVSNVSTGWTIDSVDGCCYQWNGIINHNKQFFAWKSGHSHSGYIHFEQGSFTNSAFKVGYVGNSYPEDHLRSRSNGTWYWATDGAVG